VKLSRAQLATLAELRDGPLWETPRTRRTFEVLLRMNLVERVKPNIVQAFATYYVNVTENLWGLSTEGKKLVLKLGISAA